jgi:hypothetical protein
MRVPVLLVVLVAGVTTGAAAAPVSGSAAAYERLTELVGEWRGSFEWSGARTSSGSMGARYYLTGNGSALVEDLEIDGKVVMTSVYHLDGPDLRMTHYCGARNQPRLKATSIDDGAGIVRFSFVDATNLAKPDAPHVHGLEIQLHDDRRIRLTFTFLGEGKESYERIDLARVVGAPSP